MNKSQLRTGVARGGWGVDWDKSSVTALLVLFFLLHFRLPLCPPFSTPDPLPKQMSVVSRLWNMIHVPGIPLINLFSFFFRGLQEEIPGVSWSRSIGCVNGFCFVSVSMRGHGSWCGMVTFIMLS